MFGETFRIFPLATPGYRLRSVKAMEPKWHLRATNGRPFCGVAAQRRVVSLDLLRLVTCARCLDLFAVKAPRPTEGPSASVDAAR